MDTTTLIATVVVIVIIYFFFRLVVSPLIRTIGGILLFLFAIYILQRFFGFNIDQIFARFGININTSKWGLDLNWLFGPFGHYIDLAKNYIYLLLKNVPKNQ